MSNAEYINSSNYQNLPKYPGMCRPYSRNNNNTIEQQNFTKKDTKIVSATFNPFSIYDDEDTTVNGAHHFLVPAITKDLANFKRTFKELNQNRLNNDKLHSDKVSSIAKNVHHKRCLSTNRCCVSKEHERLLHKNDISGDYCTLTRTGKLSNQQKFNNKNTSCNNNFKKENMRDFASRFVTTDDIDRLRSEERKTKSTQHVELSYSPKSLRKSKKQLKINRMIDICTCMICVKSLSYQYTHDDTDEYVKPCSCTGGSSKSVACRWLCLAPLALVLPCLLCYPAAKLCQKSCSSGSCRTRLKCPVEEHDTYEARYVRDPTEKSTFL